MADAQRAAWQTEVELSTGTVLEVQEPLEEVERRLRERWASGGGAPELVPLTRRDGRRVRVNVQHVVALVPREGGGAPAGFRPRELR